MRRKHEEFVPRCAKCGYNLTGLADNRCPECGTPFDLALLLKRHLRKPARRFGRIVFDLFVLPVLASVGTMILIATSSGVFGMIPLPVFAIFYIVFIIQNGQRIRIRATEECELEGRETNRLCSYIEEGGLGTVVLFQVVPVVLFWGIIIWLIIKYPPKFFF